MLLVSRVQLTRLSPFRKITCILVIIRVSSSYFIFYESEINVDCYSNIMFVADLM